MTTILLAALGAGMTGSAMAQPVGIGVCDNFLAAYSHCAAGSAVPASARDAVQQGIDGMRTSFRDAAARSPAAWESIRQQCVSSHRWCGRG